MSSKVIKKNHGVKVTKSKKDLESALSPIVRRKIYKKLKTPNDTSELEDTPNGGINAKSLIRKCLYDPSAQEEKENFAVRGIKHLPKSPDFLPWLASSSLDPLKDVEEENAERLGTKRSFSEVDTSPVLDGTEKKTNSQYKRAYEISNVGANPSTGLTMEIDSLFLSDLQKGTANAQKDTANAQNLENKFVPAPKTPENMGSENLVAKNLLCELDENCEQVKESPNAKFENTGACRLSPNQVPSMEKALSDMDKSMKELSFESQKDISEDSSPENASIVQSSKYEQKESIRGRVLANITNDAWASPITTRILSNPKKRTMVAFRSYNSSINASHLSEPSRVSVGSMDKMHFSLGCTGSYPMAVTPAQKDRTLKGFQVGNASIYIALSIYATLYICCTFTSVHLLLFSIVHLATWVVIV